jgi:Group II intron, maturase-specific domain/Winged helix-turn-helix DNA-binding
MFKEVGLVEKYGSGIGRIIQGFKDYGLTEPKFQEISDGFMVTVYAASAGLTAQDVTTQKSSVKSSVKTTQKTTQKILEIIKGNPAISRAELAVQIGLTPDGIKYHLDNLRKQGTLRRVGPDTWVVNEVNATVRGWVGYFHYRNCSSALKNLRYHAEERLRTHLRKRHKVKDRGVGYFRFSSRMLYGKYGLYKVPTTAGWTKAHALQ